MTARNSQLMDHVIQNSDAYKKIWIGLIAIGYFNLFASIGLDYYLYGSLGAMDTGPLWLQAFGFGLLIVTLCLPVAVGMVIMSAQMFYWALLEMAEGIREVISDEQ